MLAISFATTPELSVLSSFRFLKIAQEILISSSLHSKSLKKFIQEVTDFSNVQIISRISDNCRITFAIIVRNHVQISGRPEPCYYPDIYYPQLIFLSRDVIIGCYAKLLAAWRIAGHDFPPFRTCARLAHFYARPTFVLINPSIAANAWL